ncbi:MAG: ester cyclase [Pseudomonadales bacterium]
MKKQQVRRFYSELWDAHDTRAISEILEPDFSFRGSLGQHKIGHQGFCDYVAMVHAALDNYLCTVQELVEEGDKVFAKMSFSGIHRADFMGYAATGERVTWSGCALFSFNAARICDVWVLGDLKSLENQLEEQRKG